MKESNKKYCKHILICFFATCLVVFFLFSIKKYPEDFIYNNFGNLNEKEKLDAIKDIRSNVIYIAGGFLAIIGIYLTWRRTKALDKKNMIDENQNVINMSNNENIFLLQQFSKASELLANENSIAARLSGIYLFEKIMNTRKEYYWPIIELFTAYIRNKRNNENYWLDDKLNLNKKNVYKINHYIPIGKEYHLIDRHFNIIPIENDIQSIITILGRRNKNLVDVGYNNEKLDLSDTNLYGANFINGNFRGYNFKNSLIIKSNCAQAFFVGSKFSNAHFDYSYCRHSHFENSFCDLTFFHGTNCWHTIFEGTFFEYADFFNAYCEDSNFYNSNCLNNKFYNTNFKCSNFTKVKNLNAEQLSEAETLFGIIGLTDDMKKEIIKLNPNLEKDLS